MVSALPQIPVEMNQESPQDQLHKIAGKRKEVGEVLWMVIYYDVMRVLNGEGK